MHPFSSVKVPEGSVAIHWFEQSSFALKDNSGTVVQIDPYFPHHRPSDRFIHSKPPLDEAALATDYVLLTHNHGDHTCPESIKRIKDAFGGTRFIGPEESIDTIIAKAGVDPTKTITVVAGDEIHIGSMTVYAVYAKPPAGDEAAGIPKPDVTHLSYVLKTNGPTLYFSGDPINNFAEHDALLDPIAKLKPDLGFLTTHPNEGEFPFFDGSVKMAERIGLQTAVPAHYDCFVKRDYEPQEWAKLFPAKGPQPLLIPRNSHILYP